MFLKMRSFFYFLLLLIVSACANNSSTGAASGGSASIGGDISSPVQGTPSPLRTVSSASDAKINILTENGYLTSQVAGAVFNQESTTTENGFVFTTDSDTE